MSKSKILQEAMADAETVKKAAIQNAQNILAESMRDKIKEYIDSQLGETDFALEAGDEGPKDDDEEEKIEVPEVDEVGMYEEKEDDEEDEMDVEEALRALGEAEDKEDEDEKEREDEVVELTAEDLQAALSEVLGDSLKEASVTKSFGDVEDATLPASGGKGEKGIADEKSGEHAWEEESAPAKEDWSVKESKYRKVVNVLNSQLAEYKKACSYLKRQLQEVNVFNNKLLYTNKVLQNVGLTDKQRIAVVEMFDRANSVRDVELVYKTLSEGLKMAGVVSENKKRVRAKSSSFTTPSSTVLRESVQKEERSQNQARDRMKELAGLVK